MKKSDNENKCHNHPDIKAEEICPLCKQSVCPECLSPKLSRNFCQKCAGEIIDEVSLLNLKDIYEVLEERRKAQRITIIEPVTIRKGEKSTVNINAVMIDVSIIGIGVISNDDLPVNTILRVDFVLPFEGEFKNIQAAVIRAKKAGTMYHSGLLFMNMGNDLKRIETFILNTIKKKYIREDSPSKWQYV